MTISLSQIARPCSMMFWLGVCSTS